MSSGARIYAIIGPQSAVGVAPVTWQYARVAGAITVSQDVETVASDEVTANRLGGGEIVIGSSIGGDIPQEWSYRESVRLWESALMNPIVPDTPVVGSDTIELGSTPQYFSVATGFSDVNVNGVAKDCLVQKLSLKITASGKSTVTSTIVGLKWDDNKTANFATSPIAAGTNKFISNVDIGTIQIDGAGAPTCISEINVDIDNTINVQKCLGLGTDAGALLVGSAMVKLTFKMAWSPSAYDFQEMTLTRQRIDLQIPVIDADGNMMTLDFTGVELKSKFPNGDRNAIIEADFEGTVIEGVSVTFTDA